jgi:hypothetical protein
VGRVAASWADTTEYRARRVLLSGLSPSTAAHSSQVGGCHSSHGSCLQQTIITQYPYRCYQRTSSGFGNMPTAWPHGERHNGALGSRASRGDARTERTVWPGWQAVSPQPTRVDPFRSNQCEFAADFRLHGSSVKCLDLPRFSSIQRPKPRTPNFHCPLSAPPSSNQAKGLMQAIYLAPAGM